MQNKELSLVYRIYPGISKNPAIFSDDKLKLAELCLISFAEALKDVDAKVTVIFEKCPPVYREMFNDYLSGKELISIDTNGIGNAKTFKMQLDILTEQNDSEFIMFAEDDYFFLDSSIRKSIDFLFSQPHDTFVSPFNHPDLEKLSIHNYQKEKVTHNGDLWQKSATTTMTFITRKSTMLETKKIFETYLKDNYDASIWLSMTKYNIFNPLKIFSDSISEMMFLKIYAKVWLYGFSQNLFGKRYKFYSPINSLATHMEEKDLSKGVDWHSEFQKIIPKMKYGI